MKYCAEYRNTSYKKQDCNLKMSAKSNKTRVNEAELS